MATTNDVTGDKIQSKTNSDAYRDNYDKIFRKKEEKVVDNDEGMVLELEPAVRVMPQKKATGQSMF